MTQKLHKKYLKHTFAYNFILMGDSRIVVPVIFGILVLGILGATQFAFAGALVNTVTIDGVDTQGDC